MLTEVLICITRDITKRGLIVNDNETHIKAALDWLLLAQKVTGTGGYSSYYSLYLGWRAPFPETTGYIIPTMLEAQRRYRNNNYLDSALKAGQWLLSIQHEDGYFCEPYRKLPMVFDTSQIIFGLLALYRLTGERSFLVSSLKSADWILKVQHNDGYWKQFAYNNIPHTYYSRVSWALLELSILAGDERYKTAAGKQLDWALKHQKSNGWFYRTSFVENSNSLLHTIAYTIRGFWESGCLVDRIDYLEAARKAADALLILSEKEGILSAYYNEQWVPTNRSKCLTGLAQMSIIWLNLHKSNADNRYLQQVLNTNHFLKSHQNLVTKNINIRGAIASSYPIWGKYMPFNYLSWATKFFIDALFFENDIASGKLGQSESENKE